RLDADARELRRALARFFQRDRGRAQAGAGQRGELARDAEHREAVRTVRGDLDLEHVVVEPERGHQVRARLGARHLEDARLVLLAETELGLGAQHALRLDTVDLRGGDPPAARQHGPRRSEGGADAPARVGRAADDRVAVASGADTAEHERVAAALAELALDGLDLADDDALEVRRQRRDRGDLDAGVDEALGGLLG